MKEYSMTCLAPTVCELLQIRQPEKNEGEVIAEIVNDMGRQDRLAVIVIDAFGISTWQRYKDLTPCFNALADGHLLHVRSVMPAKTPVNFSTMVTGAPSEVHNIRDRNEHLAVETVFHVAADSSLTSAAAGREKSTAGLLLMKFAKYKCVAESNTDEELTQLAVKAIREHNPDFMLIQLLEVDDTGHKAGLDGDEIQNAVGAADKNLEKLISELAGSGYGLIVLADHGAHQVGDIATHDGSVEDDLVVPLVWRSSGKL